MYELALVHERLWQQRAVDIAAGIRGKKFSLFRGYGVGCRSNSRRKSQAERDRDDLTEQALGEAADATPVVRETSESRPVYDESTQ